MWKHYTSPIANKLMSIVEDYGIDIFLGRGTLYLKSGSMSSIRCSELSSSLQTVISPAFWLSGLLYLFYTALDPGWLRLGVTPLLHTEVAFPMLTFLVAYLYLAIPASKEPLGYLTATITGYEEK
ncbi:MAG: hypothetical protein KUF74_08600 [Candidatus Thiodiazotropha sp. (ex Ctena orbiculata)]|nr:hypothetical protein [Candidatus Thiodiazotropha taylori]